MDTKDRNMNPFPDVLTVVEVATLLDCSPTTVEAHTRARCLPGLQYGRSWVYPREALLQVLVQQALAHVAPKPVDASGPAASKARPTAPQPVRRVRGRSPAPLPDPPRVQT